MKPYGELSGSKRCFRNRENRRGAIFPNPCSAPAFRSEKKTFSPLGGQTKLFARRQPKPAGLLFFFANPLPAPGIGERRKVEEGEGKRRGGGEEKEKAGSQAG